MFMPGVWILWSKKKFVIIFQKENGNTFTLLIIFIVKSLQKEQISTNLLLWSIICRNKSAITPKWINSQKTNFNQHANNSRYIQRGANLDDCLTNQPLCMWEKTSCIYPHQSITEKKKVSRQNFSSGSFWEVFLNWSTYTFWCRFITRQSH